MLQNTGLTGIRTENNPFIQQVMDDMETLTGGTIRQSRGKHHKKSRRLIKLAQPITVSLLMKRRIQGKDLRRKRNSGRTWKPCEYLKILKVNALLLHWVKIDNNKNVNVFLQSIVIMNTFWSSVQKHNIKSGK